MTDLIGWPVTRTADPNPAEGDDLLILIPAGEGEGLKTRSVDDFRGAADNRIDRLTALTRDLHTVQHPGPWTTATAGMVASALFGSNVNVPSDIDTGPKQIDTVTASGDSDVYVHVFLDADADAARYRVAFDGGQVLGLNELVRTDYRSGVREYSGPVAWAHLDDSVAHRATLQHHGDPLESTRFDGELGEAAVRPGRIERARGHTLPADAALEWTSGTVPPVLILSPLTFESPIRSGMVVGVALTATGGGGGIAPDLTLDLRAPDNSVISTSDVLRADGREEYVLLEVTADAASVRLNLEGVEGSDSGAFDVHIEDILGFTGSSTAAQLIALIASRLIRLEDDMGITTDEAIALINQLVPPERRLPAIAGHGGEVVRVNAAGEAVVLDTPTRVVDAGLSGRKLIPDPAGHNGSAVVILADGSIGFDVREALDLAGLDALTMDLRRGSEATGWQDVASDAEGGLALPTTDQSLATAQNLTYALVFTGSDLVAYRRFAARIPTGADPAQWAALARYNGGGSDARLLLSTWESLGTAGSYDYYRLREAVSPAMNRLVLQTTTSDAHVGTTRFLGDLDRGKVYGQVAAILTGGGIVESDASHTITLPDPPVPIQVIERLKDQTQDLIRGRDSAAPTKNANANRLSFVLVPRTSGLNLTTANWQVQIDRPATGWVDGDHTLVARIDENQDLSDWEARTIRGDGSHDSFGLSGFQEVNTTGVASNPESGYHYRLEHYQPGDALYGGDLRIEGWSVTHQTTYIGSLGAGIVTLDSLAPEVTARLTP